MADYKKCDCGGTKRYTDASFASDFSYAKRFWVCDDCGKTGPDLFGLEYFDTDIDDDED